MQDSENHCQSRMLSHLTMQKVLGWGPRVRELHLNATHGNAGAQCREGSQAYFDRTTHLRVATELFHVLKERHSTDNAIHLFVRVWGWRWDEGLL